MFIPLKVPTTGEEDSLKVVQSYDDLSRKLWRLEDLPLSITSVQGAHPALRYTQVSTPPPTHKPATNTTKAPNGGSDI